MDKLGTLYVTEQYMDYGCFEQCSLHVNVCRYAPNPLPTTTIDIRIQKKENVSLLLISNEILN